MSAQFWCAQPKYPLSNDQRHVRHSVQETCSIDWDFAVAQSTWKDELHHGVHRRGRGESFCCLHHACAKSLPTERLEPHSAAPKNLTIVPCLRFETIRETVHREPPRNWPLFDWSPWIWKHCLFIQTNILGADPKWLRFLFRDQLRGFASGDPSSPAVMLSTRVSGVGAARGRVGRLRAAAARDSGQPQGRRPPPGQPLTRLQLIGPGFRFRGVAGQGRLPFRSTTPPQ